MRYRRDFLVSLLAVALATLALGQQTLRIGPHYWPTPNPEFLRTGEMEGVLQPTVSGRVESGLFGCVRNDGSRFHEGVDLMAISRDSKQESIDPVYAFDAGIVRYVNREASTSSYGRYIVIEHPQMAPGLVTLYAHLRSIPESIRAGVEVAGGQNIAIMGRSAGGYSIPRERAHLHFEIGFWLGPNFQLWYDQQPIFEDANDHGAYNGMNIIGADVWALLGALRRGEAGNAWEYLMHEQIAAEAYVQDDRVPELVQINPELLDGATIPQRLEGWLIEFTWYGLPVRFTPIEEGGLIGRSWGDAIALRPDLLDQNDCLDLVRTGGLGGGGAKLRSLLSRIFVK